MRQICRHRVELEFAPGDGPYIQNYGSIVGAVRLESQTYCWHSGICLRNLKAGNSGIFRAPIAIVSGIFPTGGNNCGLWRIVIRQTLDWLPPPDDSPPRFASTCLMDQRARKLADLVEQYYALLYRYAYRLTGSEADAEDLTQQAFLTAQTKWDQLRDEEKAKSWLFTITRNAYLKDLRTPTFLASGSLDELPGPVLEAGSADFDQEQLQNVLNDLPEEFRTPVVLFYFEEFSYKEIAEQMDVPVGTVMSRLARAKAFLRQRLTAPEPVAAAGPFSEPVLASASSWTLPNARPE